MVGRIQDLRGADSKARDQSLDIDRPMIRVRQGKGNKAIVVQVHA